MLNRNTDLKRWIKMLVLSETLKTFDHKVNKIKSEEKKKYYLQKSICDAVAMPTAEL